MTEPPQKVQRHVIKCAWKCKHCWEIFGAENVAYYGIELPDMIKPKWFFASMTLLDHLRDCRQQDYTEELRTLYGTDFPNHPRISEFFNRHALIERTLLSQTDLEQE